jgi:hypothetical protein
MVPGNLTGAALTWHPFEDLQAIGDSFFCALAFFLFIFLHEFSWSSADMSL